MTVAASATARSVAAASPTAAAAGADLQKFTGARKFTSLVLIS